MPYVKTTAALNPTRRAWRNNFSGLRGLRGRGLGVLSVPVGTSMVYSTPAISRIAIPVRPGGPPRLLNADGPTVMWGGNPPAVSSPWGSNPIGANNAALAQAAEQYATNPASLTQTQWSQLQAAGAIPATVPYSSAPLVPAASGTSASGAIDPATGVPYATELAAAQASGVASSSSIMGTDPVTGATTILGIDWYWLAAAAVGLYLFTGKRR
jgi:hypothetical protein